MIVEIRDNVRRRGITRLCHFTPSRNLVHIVTDPRGLLASGNLEADERAVFNPTDAERFDGFPDHVCCSIQYPNAWYFRKARAKDTLFRDWVVLFISPHHLWTRGTRFCPRNAAANYGRDVRGGPEAFDALFASNVLGARDRVYSRSDSHPVWLPTDEQAEVLIPDRVAREDLMGIAVADESQAKREMARLRTLNQRLPQIVIARKFFNPNWLSAAVRSGALPEEREYEQGGDDA